MENKVEMVTITKQSYLEFLERDNWLACLEAAGVDNWCGYGEAFEIKKEWEQEE